MHIYSLLFHIFVHHFFVQIRTKCHIIGYLKILLVLWKFYILTLSWGNKQYPHCSPAKFTCQHHEIWGKHISSIQKMFIEHLRYAKHMTGQQNQIACCGLVSTRKQPLLRKMQEFLWGNEEQFRTFLCNCVPIKL